MYLPKRNKNVVCQHKAPTWIFIWAKMGKSVHKQMNGLNKLWYIQSMECSAGTKRNEFLTQATTQTNLHRYYVGQRKSDMKEHTLYDSIYTCSRTGNTNLWRQKIRMVAASDLGGDWEGTGGNSLGNKSVRYLVSGMGFTGVHICQNSSDRIHIIHASCWWWIKPHIVDINTLVELLPGLSACVGV